jgi:hypothetical protein
MEDQVKIGGRLSGRKTTLLFVGAWAACIALVLLAQLI